MKDDLIKELLHEVRAEQRDQTETLNDIKVTLAINTKELTEHKEGVIQNRGRIENLEILPKTLKTLVKWFIKLGSVAAAATAIYYLIKLL